MIDGIDIKILTILQENGRESNASIARKVGMAPSAILERIRRLESRGVLQGFEARVDPKSIELGLVAFVFVRAEERLGRPEAGERLAALPEVLEVHHIAGEDCYLVKVRARDTETLGRVLRERFGSIPQVTSTKTTIVLETVKETARLPLPAAEEGVA
jgi:Lrp/AsnC family transcriptional regulator, leucine-responsive regulatory protein